VHVREIGLSVNDISASQTTDPSRTYDKFL